MANWKHIATSRHAALVLIGLSSALNPVAAAPPAKTLPGTIEHKQYVYCIAFSPNGDFLAVGGGDRPFDEAKGSAELALWDVKTRKKVRSFEGHTAYVYALTFSPDGKSLASAADDYTIRIWDVATGKEAVVLKDLPRGTSSIAYSPDGATLAAGKLPPKYSEVKDAWKLPGTVILWDTRTYKVRAKLEGHAGYVTAVAFSPDGKTLAASSGKWDEKKDRYDSSEVQLWDPVTAKLCRTLKGHRDTISSLAFSPDGKTLATGSISWEKSDKIGAQGEVKLWDFQTAKVQVSATIHEGAEVARLIFSPDGKVLASASGVIFDQKDNDSGFAWHQDVVLMEGKTLKLLGSVPDLKKCFALAFSPVGLVLATGSETKVTFWELAERK
jgi:WD40 repeat protein